MKDPALSLLWLGFDPRPGELLHAEGEAKKKEKGRVENDAFRSSCYGSVVNEPN